MNVGASTRMVRDTVFRARVWPTVSLCWTFCTRASQKGMDDAFSTKTETCLMHARIYVQTCNTWPVSRALGLKEHVLQWLCQQQWCHEDTCNDNQDVLVWGSLFNYRHPDPWRVEVRVWAALAATSLPGTSGKFRAWVTSCGQQLASCGQLWEGLRALAQPWWAHITENQ